MPFSIFNVLEYYFWVLKSPAKIKDCTSWVRKQQLCSVVKLQYKRIINVHGHQCCCELYFNFLCSSMLVKFYGALKQTLGWLKSGHGRYSCMVVRFCRGRKTREKVETFFFSFHQKKVFFRFWELQIKRWNQQNAATHDNLQINGQLLLFWLRPSWEIKREIAIVLLSPGGLNLFYLFMR